MAKNPNELPADFAFPEELPANFDFGSVPTNEIVNDPRAAGLEVPAEIPAEVVPQSWLEAMFPRTARADGAGATASGLALDVLSGPGRAYESSVPAWRAPGESFQDALGRTAPREDEGWMKQGTSTLLRDPANIPMAVLAPFTGGTSVAPWLAKLGWAGKGMSSGAAMGSTVAATRQAENVAAGRPLDAVEVGNDVATGAALGVGFPLLGKALAGGGRWAQRTGKNILQSIIKPQGVDEIQGFERALEAGLLPEFAGYGTLTAKGAGKRFLGRLDDQAAGYEPALAAADATGQRVNASQVMRTARGDVAGRVSGGGLTVSPESAQRGIDWAGDIMAAPGSADEVMARMAGITPDRMARGPVVALARQAEIAPASTMRGPVVIREQVAAPPPTAFQDVMVGGVRRRIGEAVPQNPQLGATMAEMGGQSLPARTMEVGTGKYRELVGGVAPSPQDVTLLPSVANRRKSGMWKEAFKSQDADQTARGAGALATGRAANEELGKISPELAELNTRLAPYYAGSDAALRAATTRGNQYFIGPMELWGGAIGAGTGSAAGLGGAASGTIGAVIAARLARSPAFARSMYDAGRISEATYRAFQSPGGQTLGRQLLAGSTLAASPTDNARGGR